jgi:serine/threonine protein kinase
MGAVDTVAIKQHEAPTNDRTRGVSRPSDPKIPDRYQVLSEIGQGGMGIVYKVRDLDMVEVVALKVLKPEIATDGAMRETLRKEVALARKVTHRNVCRIYEFHRSDVSACVSMEFVDGESLLSRLHRLGRFSAHESIAIGRQVCAGLREAHLQGIVHRDLKPANIMLDASGCVKIMDFGIARLSQDTGHLTRTFVGTPNYMSPEQVELKPTGPRSDIYSLGLVLYEMATGVTAFEGDSPILVALDQLRRTPRRPSLIVPIIPANLEKVILKCLQKDASKRYESVDKLDEALEACVEPRESSLAVARERISVALSHSVKAARLAGLSIASVARRIRVHRFDLQKGSRSGWRDSNWLARLDGALTPARMYLAQVGAVFGLVFMVCAIAFGLAAGHSARQRPTMPLTGYAARQQQALRAAAFGKPPVTSQISDSVGEDIRVFSGEVDLSSAAGLANSGTSSSGGLAADSASRSDSVSASDSASDVHRQAAVRRVPLKRTKTRIQPSVSLPISASVTQDVLAPLAIMKPANLGVSNAPHKSVGASASAAPANPAASKYLRLPFPATYLEVGSFKDAEWADSAVDRLSHLGFKAISVHKGHLWAHSYHVEVGPYTRVGDLEKAESDLTAQGFKPRAVK